MQEKEVDLPAPPQELLTRNPLKWFRFFGPGAIIASVTIGSGELVFPARGGSLFGYAILWVFLWAGALKWVLAYSSMRHMVLTGVHPLERWSNLPGPRGWLPMAIVVAYVVTIPVWYSFLTALVGETCTWASGMGNDYLWAIAGAVGAILLLMAGGYQFMEKVQLLIVGAMVVISAVAAIYIRPDWGSAIYNALVPQKLGFPEWVRADLPDVSSRSELVEILVYVSVIGGQSYDYLGYLALLREKKWGYSDRPNGLTTVQLEQVATQPRHPARLWVRAALVDTTVSFLMVVAIANCFAILGTVLLKPKHLVPNGMNLIKYQGGFLEMFSPALLPLYQLAVFLAFFGILYSGPEIGYRLCSEYLLTTKRWTAMAYTSWLRWTAIIWCLVGGVAVLWLSRPFPELRPLNLLTPVGIVTGVFMCGIYCFLNLWSDYRFLPSPLRMPKPLVLFNLSAGCILVAAGVKALWDHNGVTAFLGLASGVAFSMIAAHAFRGIYDDETES